MRHLFAAFLFCTMIVRPCGAADVPATSASPTTPALEQLHAWLGAINSGNRDVIRSFVSEHMAPPPDGTLPVDGLTDRNVARFADTGGMELRQVAASEPNRVAAVVQAKRGGNVRST